MLKVNHHHSHRVGVGSQLDEEKLEMISVEEVVAVKTRLPRWHVALNVSEGSQAGAGIASRSDLDHWSLG